MVAKQLDGSTNVGDKRGRRRKLHPQQRSTGSPYPEWPLVLFKSSHGMHFSLEPRLLITFPRIHSGRSDSQA